MSYNATHGGKGDYPRPVDSDKYRTNYDLIFRKNEHETKHLNTEHCKQKRATLKAARKDRKTNR